LSDSTTPIFLTIEEVAELLRLSERSVYNLARGGRLAGAVKVGNQWRVDRGALMAWVKEEGQPAKVAGSSGGTSSVADAAFMGKTTLNYAGQKMLGGHDWMGDGVSDLAIAAPGYLRTGISGADAGALYVFFGRGL
jgi:excisionase family DNA binding protein